MFCWITQTVDHKYADISRWLQSHSVINWFILELHRKKRLWGWPVFSFPESIWACSARTNRLDLWADPKMQFCWDHWRTQINRKNKQRWQFLFIARVILKRHGSVRFIYHFAGRRWYWQGQHLLHIPNGAWKVGGKPFSWNITMLVLKIYAWSYSAVN